MRISIIIPAFNEERLLGATLRELKLAAAAFTRLGWDTELIVCDNNSTDRTAEIALAAGAGVVFEPENSIAGARNRGAEAASGDWLVFIDADSLPTADLFADVAEEIQSGQCIAGGCTARLDERHAIADAIMGFWNWLSRARRLLGGYFIFCQTATFRSLGGFNPKLFMSEDIDLSIRLRRVARITGKRTVVLHQHPLLTSARKVRLYGVGRYFWFWMKTALTLGRTVTSRKACSIWYDGKR